MKYVKIIIILIVLIFIVFNELLAIECSPCTLNNKNISIKQLYEKDVLKASIYNVSYGYCYCSQTNENEIFIKSFEVALYNESANEKEAIKKLFNLVINQVIFNNLTQESLINSKVKLFMPCCIKVTNVNYSDNRVYARFDNIVTNDCCCYIEYYVTGNPNNCNSSGFGVSISPIEKKINCNESSCTLPDCLQPNCTTYSISELLDIF
jgi:hypothetical protein